MSDKVIKIVGIAGSIRRKSYNKSAILAAQELLPENAVMDIVDLSDIPMFNEDIEAEGTPEAVADFNSKLAKADAVIIATPEYNFSIPPILKNALDWASRYKDLPLYGKPLAIMSATPGMLGGSRVQYHLRQVCVSLNLIPVSKPEVFISNAHMKFDDTGKLIDEETKKLIVQLLDALLEEVKNK